MTGSPLHQLATFERLWSAFAAPLVGAKRWGRVERTDEPFTPDAAAALTVLQWTRVVFVDGADGFKAMISLAGSLVSISIWWRPAAVATRERREAWLDWIAGVAETHPVLFGYGSMGTEHDVKHLVADADSRGWVGSSTAELAHYLPGIYWLTVFGRELASVLSVASLTAISGVQVRALGGDQVMVVLDEPPAPNDMAAR